MTTSNNVENAAARHADAVREAERARQRLVELQTEATRAAHSLAIAQSANQASQSSKTKQVGIKGWGARVKSGVVHVFAKGDQRGQGTLTVVSQDVMGSGTSGEFHFKERARAEKVLDATGVLYEMRRQPGATPLHSSGTRTVFAIRLTTRDGEPYGVDIKELRVANPSNRCHYYTGTVLPYFKTREQAVVALATIGEARVRKALAVFIL